MLELYFSITKNTRSTFPFHPPSLNPMVCIYLYFPLILYGLKILELCDLWHLDIFNKHIQDKGKKIGAQSYPWCKSYNYKKIFYGPTLCSHTNHYPIIHIFDWSNIGIMNSSSTAIHNTSLSTLSYALSKSMKTMYKSFLFFKYLSIKLYRTYCFHVWSLIHKTKLPLWVSCLNFHPLILSIATQSSSWA